MKIDKKPSQVYLKTLKAKKLSFDYNQSNLVELLDNYFLTLKEIENDKKNLFKKFSFNKKRLNYQGFYIYGPVGTGKTMIMDNFYESIDFMPKKRKHFHSFINGIHENINFFRKKKNKEPIKKTAEIFFRKTKLLCLDEFQINDITDAMIVGRLFKYFFELGIFVFITSNTPPDQLYKNGINRDLFIPFINLIKEKTNVKILDSKIDYRKITLKGKKVYFSPINKDEKESFDKLWETLSEGKNEILEIYSSGRKIIIKNFFNGVARENFKQICGLPLSTNDYIKMVKYIKLFFLEDIPLFSENNSDEARRFINFIDTLYDKKCVLICLASKEPEQLYSKGPLIDVFRRTSSRLIQMQSKEWLEFFY